jgi:hypothetical protein
MVKKASVMVVVMGLAVASVAGADVMLAGITDGSGAGFPQVDLSGNVAFQASCDGCVVNQVVLNGGTTHFLSAVLQVVLTEGSMYNQAVFGTNNPPSPALVGVFGDLVGDTWVGAVPGGDLSNSVNGSVIESSGVEIDLLPHSGGPEFGATQLRASWFNTAEDDLADNLVIGQITFSADAVGTYQLRVDIADAAGGNPNQIQIGTAGSAYPGLIQNGSVVIPEPATMGLMLIAGLVAMGRKRAA